MEAREKRELDRLESPILNVGEIDMSRYWLDSQEDGTAGDMYWGSDDWGYAWDHFISGERIEDRCRQGLWFGRPPPKSWLADAHVVVEAVTTGVTEWL